MTIGDTTYPLPRPFLVVATQNPVDQEGTYPLPEAQIDRFMLKIVVDYPSLEEEKGILSRMTSSHRYQVSPIVTASNILAASALVNEIYIDERIQTYIVNLVYATRHAEQYGLPKVASCIARGASPRATVALANAARAMAFMDMRDYVTPEDIQSLAIDVLQHRISLTYEAEVDHIHSLAIIDSILSKVEVP